jgi:hypothetical protein
MKIGVAEGRMGKLGAPEVGAPKVSVWEVDTLETRFPEDGTDRMNRATLNVLLGLGP